MHVKIRPYQIITAAKARILERDRNKSIEYLKAIRHNKGYFKNRSWFWWFWRIGFKKPSFAQIRHMIDLGVDIDCSFWQTSAKRVRNNKSTATEKLERIIKACEGANDQNYHPDNPAYLTEDEYELVFTRVPKREKL